jgi:hypothetical protein
VPSTIRDLTELTTIAADDYFLISDTSDVTNRDKRISRTNLNSPFKSGAPVAGRIASWADANTVQDGGFAISDIARLSVANNFAALATFAAGVNFGGTTLNQYVQNTWTPTDASGAGLTLTTAIGRYTRIGRMLFAPFAIGFPSTADTAGMVIGGLPFTPLAITGSTGGGGFLYSTSLLFPVTVLVATTAVLLFSNANTNVSVKNSDMSGKFIRGMAVYDI